MQTGSLRASLWLPPRRGGCRFCVVLAARYWLRNQANWRYIAERRRVCSQTGTRADKIAVATGADSVSEVGDAGAIQPVRKRAMTWGNLSD